MKQACSLTMTILVITSMLCPAQTLPLPPRPPTAPTGSALIAQWTPLSRDEREMAIFGHVMKGNIPDFYRTLIPVTTTTSIGGQLRTATFFVLPDYLALGSNNDYFYTPMTPILAQKIASALHCSLPTKRLVDTIYARATVKLRPQPIPPTDTMITVPVFAQHNDSVRTQRALFLPHAPLGALVGGNKKDLIISNSITQNLKTNVPRPVVIYGWHQLNGVAIQPVYNGHEYTYADYSHGTRLVMDSVLVDGVPTTLQAILADAALCVLASDEGVIAQPSYPYVLATPTPRSFGLVPDGPTSLSVVFNPLEGLTYYAYAAKYGSSFVDSVVLQSGDLRLTGLETDSLYLFRLRAFDGGNASAFSEVLAATPAAAASRILIVHGFDRATAGNTFDFTKHHAKAFAANGERIASATNDAVTNGIMRLTDFSIVDYVLGDESTVNETFSTAEQQVVRAFLQNGGSLFVSGAEIAWDLDAKGTASDKLFIADVLKARYANDAPNGVSGVTYSAEPTGTLFAGVSTFSFDNGTHGSINVKYPDVLRAVNGGSACLRYTGFTDTIAGVSYRGAFSGGTNPGAVVFWGFPFESVYPEAMRATLAGRILAYFTSSTEVETKTAMIPGGVELGQNFPNPFNPSTTLSFELSVLSSVDLRVYDLLGREVAELMNGIQPAGTYSIAFDGTALPTGVYVYRLQTDDGSVSRRMILLK